MKNGRCPMCNSSEVYFNPEAEFRNSGGVLELDDTKNRMMIYPIPYVCRECGFVAMYVEELEEIRDLPNMKGWKKAGEGF
jgi:hypothetical protein